MIDVNAALKEIKTKSLKDIEYDTAWRWASRAIAALVLANQAQLDDERAKWLGLSRDFKHEALEHAALQEDNGTLVKRVQEEIETYGS